MRVDLALFALYPSIN